MSNPAITLVPLRRYYDTATIAETSPPPAGGWP